MGIPIRNSDEFEFGERLADSLHLTSEELKGLLRELINTKYNNPSYHEAILEVIRYNFECEDGEIYWRK